MTEHLFGVEINGTVCGWYDLWPTSRPAATRT